MKFFVILTLMMAMSCFGQSTSSGQAETKGLCSPALTGSGNIVTLTCYNVDRKLADQIGKLVASSKQDNKTLQEISEKLDAILAEIRDANTVRVEIVQISSNELMQVPHSLNNRSGTAYESRWRVTVNGSVPAFHITISEPITSFIMHPEHQGLIMGMNGGSTGPATQLIHNATGSYVLDIQSIVPLTNQPAYTCEGVRCIGPS
ncbi:MAG: hypothetical protein WAN35_19750 [Terracidiphilus sp.]